MTRTAPPAGMLPPGSTIGMLGGGQLGRMTALSAARLGYRVHVLTPETDSPAAQVSAAVTVAAYDDGGALDRFARAVDVVTYEFENVPLGAVARLAPSVPVRPGGRVLEVAQDRVAEKRFANALGIATAPWREVGGAATLADALAEIGRPAVLKSTRLGYDGKGQVRIDAGGDPADAWRRMGSDAGILEGFVDFTAEISVVAARGLDGRIACYPPVENRHEHHILDVTLAPARLAPAQTAAALDIAHRLIEALDVVGLLAVEMFVARDGRILVNEMAPRPHNSGHWTIEACPTSQFEQHVRAVCGLPLGPVAPHHDAVMTNLIGDDVQAWPALLAEPGAHLHLYGKAEARPGRKMGHVTRLYPLGRRPDG